MRKGTRMSRKNITVMLMVLTMAALSLSACGKKKDNNINNETTSFDNISTDNTNENNQKIQSESTKESVNGRDTTSSDSESIAADEKKSSQENTSKGQDNNIDTELQPVSIIPESTGSSNGDTDKNVSKPESASSGNDKNQGSKNDPIELPFVPAH